MQFTIHSRDLSPTPAIDQHVRDRFVAALDQHEGRIEHVDVRLADINGSRGGVDKSCRVSVGLRPTGTVIVDEVNADLYAAVSLAADRVKNAVGRELERRRRH